MSTYQKAQQLLRDTLPELASYLKETHFDELEGEQSQAINIFKAAGGASTLVKEKYGGKGLSAWQAVQLQMAIGGASPSLAIAAGMHQFSIATLQEMAKVGNGLESLMLEGISRSNLLVSSAFSEGQIGKSILKSQIIAKEIDKGYVISGVKKPCSLAHCMDLLTASVQVEPKSGEPYFAVAMIHKACEGISVEKFWQAPFLKASQSEAVVLENVFVPHSMLVNVDEKSAYQSHVAGFVWFELITCASYLGMVCGLVERASELGRLQDSDKAKVHIQLEACALSLKAIAGDMNDQTQDTLAQVLSVRYHLQDVLADVTQNILSLVGGINYINTGYFATIAQVIHAFNFHPPAKHAMYGPLNQYFDGQELEMV
ncbi:acyl-CoA dehydrogenase family protein [Pseudoalteromonas sp. Of7M-16]|uniref:acyl-CoA dehydrogenase family protein n=1 Tax=Pseudoalteromonas sp. Of7M-16 TaxID=2917756 RepID=UPI001EF74F2D|nr:acyl-CoA dehydrogenase family protein [Pseudoalteromonas sp. Of7M-16]MCG7547583.1 acyl-CoA/acyl-ACP dehydrogenase [Pseudoalteromonas sp. Of7M-16]